jgi:hypothetical protein
LILKDKIKNKNKIKIHQNPNIKGFFSKKKKLGQACEPKLPSV